MSDDERPAKDEAELAAPKARYEKHQDPIVYEGGPFGPNQARLGRTPGA